jgi:hypothetical protein
MSTSDHPDGIVVIVKAAPFDGWLLTVITTEPDDAPDGTTPTIDELLQLTTEAFVPLNEIVLVF